MSSRFRTQCIQVASLLALLLVLVGQHTVQAQVSEEKIGRAIVLTLAPDYAQGTVYFVGMVLPRAQDPTQPVPDLELDDQPLTVENMRSMRTLYYALGQVQGGSVITKEGKYHLRLPRFTLTPSDQLVLLLPFTNVILASEAHNCSNNLQTLSSGMDDLNMPYPLRELQSNGEPLSGVLLCTGVVPELDLILTPMRTQTELSFTPLVGEALSGKKNSMSLAGRLIISGIESYAKFNALAQTQLSFLEPAPLDDFLRFHLDYPYRHRTGAPGNKLLLMKSIKPTSLYLITTNTNGEFDVQKGGQITVDFRGRPIIRQGTACDEQPCPPNKYHDCHYDRGPTIRAIVGHQHEYVFQHGLIMLGPEDVLTVTMPYVTITDVQPEPDEAVYGPRGLERLVYRGPKSMMLKLSYTPQSALVQHQALITLRALVASLELGLSESFNRVPWLVWGLAVLLALGSLAFRRPSYKWVRFALWWASGLVLVYGLNNSFAWLLMGPVLYAISTSLSWQRLARAAGMIALIWLAYALDRLILAPYDSLPDFISPQMKEQIADRFAIFSSLHTDSLSPLTPLILAILLSLLLWLAYRWQKGDTFYQPADWPAMAFMLLIFATYDVRDRSILTIALIGFYGLILLFLLARATRPLPLVASQPAEGQRIDDALPVPKPSLWNRSSKLPRTILLWLLRRLVGPAQQPPPCSNDTVSQPTSPPLKKPLSPEAALSSHLHLIRRHPKLILTGAALVIFVMQIQAHPNFVKDLAFSIFWPWGGLLAPFFVFLSIALSFVSLALLFLLLYPLLPFQAGYLKASCFAVAVFLIFLLGIGTNRIFLSAPISIFMGRFIYYLSIPLLITFYLEVENSNQAQKQGFGSAALTYMKELKSKVMVVASIVSILAPSLYALAKEQPFLTNYYTLLELLLSF